MTASTSEQATQVERLPIEWGDNLAPVRAITPGLHNDYLIVYAERKDGSVREFGEATKTGLDGAHETLQTGRDDPLAVGRAKVYKGVRAVMELEKLLHPEATYGVDKPRAEPDWVPEAEESAVAHQGLTSALEPLVLRRKVQEIHDAVEELGGVEALNNVLAQDGDLAVGLQKDDSNQASIIKLVGFEEYTYVDPSDDKESVGIRAIIEDRRGEQGLRPDGAHIERLFIKRS